MKLLKQIFDHEPQFDRLIEGLYADQYQSPETRAYIRAQYKKLHEPEVTPWTNPELYDPCEPPQGWRWDPYYEMWIQL